MDRGAWWAAVHGVKKSRTQLSTHTHTFLYISQYTHMCVCMSLSVYVLFYLYKLVLFRLKLSHFYKGNSDKEKVSKFFYHFFNLLFYIGISLINNVVLVSGVLQSYSDIHIHVSTEKAMAPHSSTLAWKIPWTEEPGRLQSMGSLRVGHD